MFALTSTARSTYTRTLPGDDCRCAAAHLEPLLHSNQLGPHDCVCLLRARAACSLAAAASASAAAIAAFCCTTFLYLEHREAVWAALRCGPGTSQEWPSTGGHAAHGCRSAAASRAGDASSSSSSGTSFWMSSAARWLAGSN